MTSIANPELVLALQQQVEVNRRLLEAVKADGLRFYSPHAKQDEFHVAGCRFDRRGLFTGNRFGKSQSGCAEDIAWLRGERSWYKRSFDVLGIDRQRSSQPYIARRHEGGEDHPYVRGGIPQHPNKGLVITTDWDKVDEIWTSQRGDKPGKVWRYMPNGFLKGTRRNHSGAIDMVECMNGSVLRFDTVKSWLANPMGTESSDFDFIHVDEPCPEGMFKGAARGLVDRNGAAWFSLTALSEPWIVDMFHENGFNTPLRGGFWTLQGTIYDNPYLGDEAIAKFEALLTEDEKQCRLMGIPLHMAGLVYKAFRFTKHVLHEPPVGWASLDDPPDNYTIHIRIDPHPQTPHAVLFCAVSPLGYRFYFTDIFMPGTVHEVADAIKRVVRGRTVGSIKIDPCAYVEDQNHPGTTLAGQFMRAGVPVTKARKDLDAGIIKVNQELAREPQTIWFCSTARRTLWEIQRYCWDPKGNNKPVDRDDHCMECLYRMELDEPFWSDDRNYSIPVEDIVISTTDTEPIEIGDLEHV